MTAIELPYTKRTLGNGLDVLVHEDRHVPVVAVNVWYHVGSKNERPGRTGFAHLFEHLMFEGSEHHDSGYFPPLQQAGALLNGSTNTDRTNYWEVVPTSAVDLALFMESDRMGYLLPALTRERFENQRDVVLNERRQNYENRPYGGALMAVSAALYPSDHPYHWLTIGAAEDISAMQLDEVQDFFRTYYHPANASLTIAGDIDTDRAFDLAEHYFGELLPGARPAPVSMTAELTHEVRLSLEDRIEMPRIYMAWHSPAMFGDGDAEMDLLGDLLANGKTSRLYRRLVYDSRLALDVSAYQNSREMAGFFLLVATAAPGKSLTDVAAAIDEELQQLIVKGPTEAEMERGVAQTEAHFLYRLQTVGGFGGKSDQLNAYNVYRGEPGFFAADLARYRTATAESVRARAAAHLAFDRRVLLSVVPRGHLALALPRVGTGDGVMSRVDRSQVPEVGPDPAFRFPAIVRHQLKNGLQVRTVEHRKMPIVTFVLQVDGGIGADPADLEGLAAVTADMVDEGTGNLSAIDVSDAMSQIGAEYDVDAGADTTAFTLTTLTRFAPRGAQLLASIVTQPSLLETDFTRVRQLRLDRLAQIKDLPPAVAERAFLKLLYNGHPYGHLAIGNDAALRRMQLEDVASFHAASFAPSRSTLVVAGAMTHGELLNLAEEAFAGWEEPRDVTAPVVAADIVPPVATSARFAVVPRDGAAQSELRIGHLSARRDTPDYPALLVMNAVLGGQFVSRINLKLREEKGYTYGARTGFDWRRGLAPFVLQASVHTAATVDAIHDSLNELEGLRGVRPPTANEMALAKASLTRGYPRGFETVQQVARSVAALALYRLPDTYFEEFVPKIHAVDAGAVTAAARAYLDPSRLTTLVVGDHGALASAIAASDLGSPQILPIDA